jgi:hypothetical protein
MTSGGWMNSEVVAWMPKKKLKSISSESARVLRKSRGIHPNVLTCHAVQSELP